MFCVFSDLANEFDTVNHSQILDALWDLGFRNNAFKLIESHLGVRTNLVKINETISEGTVVYYGGPQGILLGPLYFQYVQVIFSSSTRSDQ